MLTEWIQSHSLLPLLAASSSLPNRGLVPPASERARWNALSEEKKSAVRALWEQYAPLPYPMRTASGFLAFVENGSRRADEDPYFLRRRKLCAAVLRCALEPEAPMTDVVDGIWCICEETSWVISAHNVNPVPGAPSPKEYPLPDPDRPYIDLFSAQTAMILAYTLGILEDRLNQVTPQLPARIRRELKHRVLDPFRETDDFWWMGVLRSDLNNWTPWILSNLMVAACLCPLPDAELAPFLARSCVMLDRYLDCLPADGGCDEGAGYWNMAGGALLDCLELLETVTGGAMAFWREEKIRNILSFPLKAEIGNGWFVNFADCDARPFLSGERLMTAGEKLGDPALKALGRRYLGSLQDQLSDVPHLTRVLSLLFHEAKEPASSAPHCASKKDHGPAAPDASKKESFSADPVTEEHIAAERDVFLPDLQLRVLSRGGWTLACKGGHNGENHNHNDVGSFILCRKGQPRVVDAGNMVYTALTFSEKRYTLWNVRAAYHNLPMIGDIEQAPGQQYAAREVQCLPDGFSLDLGGAYPPEAGLLSLKRIFSLSGNGLTLRDTLRTAEARPVTWVFMLRDQPALKSGEAAFGDIALRFSPALTSSVEEIPVTDNRMARSFPGSLWRLTLSAAPADHHGETFRFIGR